MLEILISSSVLILVLAILQIGALLHDCGKYVSLVDIGERSYDIIMATEIIGLSHAEREIVASVVRYNHSEFVYYSVNFCANFA